MRRRRPVYDVQLNPLTSPDDLRGWADSHELDSPPHIAASVAVDEAEAFNDLDAARVLTIAERLLRLE